MAKFYIPLGFRYWDHGEEGKGVEHEIATAKDYYSHVGSVYGPYPDQKAVDESLQRNWPNEKKELFLVFDGEIQKVPVNKKERLESEKRQSGNPENYRIDKEEKWWCKTCDGPVMTATVHHSVWDGIFPGSGGGEVRCSYVPYCPNCEHEPNSSGAPVYEREL